MMNFLPLVSGNTAELYFSNKAKMFELSDTYRAKIKAYREELKQLLKEEDANKQHT